MGDVAIQTEARYCKECNMLRCIGLMVRKLPVSMSGKTIVENGTATVKETTVIMLRHYAEDGGKSKEEIATIKDPKKEIVLQAKGNFIL